MGDDFLPSSFYIKRFIDSLGYVNPLVLEKFVVGVFEYGICYNIRSWNADAESLHSAGSANVIFYLCVSLYNG
jgi:hypothetical protein